MFRGSGLGDIKPNADPVAECKNAPACAPAKHHFDECTERVTKAIDEDGEANEDCVEECTYIPYSARHRPSHSTTPGEQQMKSRKTG